MNEQLSLSQKDQIDCFYQKWEAQRIGIESMYRNQNRQVHEQMQQAILNYEKMLTIGGMEQKTGQYRLSPLNGFERLAFVKEKIATRYAFIQLDALYTESKKKAARLFAQRK